MGMIADRMRSHLKQVAESDAKMLRATNEMLTEVRKQIAAIEAPMLEHSEVDEIAEAIALLEANGYTVTR